MLVGLLFLGVYLVDGVLPRDYVRDDATLFVKVVYHVVLVSLLVAVTFIDADLTTCICLKTNVRELTITLVNAINFAKKSLYISPA